MEREVELLVGGKRVDLNRFASEVVRNVVLGLMQSLRDVDPAEEVVLKLAKQGRAGK